MTLQMGDSSRQDHGGAGIREGGLWKYSEGAMAKSADVDGRGIENDLHGEDVARGAGKMAPNAAVDTPRGRANLCHHLCCLLALYLEQGTES